MNSYILSQDFSRDLPAIILNLVALEGRSLHHCQQQQHLGMQILGSTPDLLNHKLCEWSPAIYVLTSAPADSGVHSSLRTTDLAQRKKRKARNWALGHTTEKPLFL